MTMFSPYAVLIGVAALWASACAHAATTPMPTTEDAGHCLEEYSSCTDSEWETYTVLRPSASPSAVRLEEKVDQLQKTVNSLLTVINSSCTDDPEDNGQIYRDCQEIFARGLYKGDGEYFIHPEASSQPFYVYCAQDPDGFWTVIQKRVDVGENFERDWADYKVGFGSIDGNHWLGNQKIHEMTYSGLYTLRVDLADWEGNSVYADYSGFYIEGESDNYRLRLRSYSGNASDSLTPQKDMQFSTKEQDHDIWSNNCAVTYGSGGGWWFSNCCSSTLNGKYNPSSSVSAAWQGIIWSNWKGSSYSLKTTTMKIKPAIF